MNLPCNRSRLTILCGWGLWVLLMGSGCNDPLQHNLEESEANAMVVALDKHGFDAEKLRDPTDGERWAVSVPSQQRVEAWSILQQEGFPRPESGGFAEFYPGGGLIPTSQEERVVLQYATSRELQASLLHVEGIVDAHVHLVLPDKPRVQMSGDEVNKPRASVLVQWSESADGPPLEASQIRQLVSGAVENLEPESVFVVMNAVAAARPVVDERELTQVGPIAVAPQSQQLLRITVLVMGGVIIALSAGLAFVLMKRREVETSKGVA